MKTLPSTHTKATIAGVLLIATALINYLYHPLVTLIKPFSDIESVYLWGYFIKPIVVLLLALIGYVILLQTKPNKPTRVALYILMASWVISIISTLCIYFMRVPEMPEVVYVIVFYFDVLVSVCSIYPYGLIYRNNDVDRCDISWINIYIFGNIGGVLIYIFSLIHGFCDYYTVSDSFFGEYIVFNETALFKIFNYCFMVLMLITHWRFTHCAAFTGTDEQKTPAQENYKPITRYVVAVLVALALGTGIFFLLLHFADPLLHAIG